jgi:hypothetical protein
MGSLNINFSRHVDKIDVEMRWNACAAFELQTALTITDYVHPDSTFRSSP